MYIYFNEYFLRKNQLFELQDSTYTDLYLYYIIILYNKKSKFT